MKRITLYILMLTSFALLSIEAIAQNTERGTHVVKSGETLYRISKMYDITVEQLYQLNPEARDGLNPGQVLQLPTYQDDKEVVYHMVQLGETLYSISKKYGVKVEEILNANTQIEKPTEITAGMIVKIPPRSKTIEAVSEGGASPSSPSLSEGMTGLKLITVAPGATVYSLLKQTGWSEAQLLHYNPQLKEGLKAGMSILIPDSSIRDNLAIGDTPPLMDFQTVVLALPFATDNSNRFKKYYEGFLMALLNLKRSGASFSLHVVDCSDSKMAATMEQLDGMQRLDMIIGGVSDTSVKQLAALARKKRATLVIPFTSRKYNTSEVQDLLVYQVNTPHDALYAEAARKFVYEYQGYHVHFVKSSDGQSDKISFINVLRQELSKAGMTYTEAQQIALSSPEAVRNLSVSYKNVVVVPTSGSITAANDVLHPIAIATDSLGVSNVTAFGYPEWQTYFKSIGNMMSTVEASFYTTFHADPDSADYKEFEQDFKKWYGHGLGSTFPRYGLLGYDTGRYFLTDLYRNGSTFAVKRGIQSEFNFQKSKGNPNVYSNMGIFFVRYNRQGATRRY